MAECYEFDEFRVRAVDQRGYAKIRVFWSKPVGPDRLTRYTLKELLRVRWWLLRYYSAKMARGVEIEGRKGRGRWKRVSSWQRSRTRPRTSIGLAEVTEQMRQVLLGWEGAGEPKLGEMVYHLKGHLRRSDEETLAVMKLLGRGVYRYQLAKLRYYGSVRRGECRFCGGSG